MKHRILLALAATGLLGATAFSLYGIESKAADGGETMIAAVPGVSTEALNAEIDRLFAEDEMEEMGDVLD